MTTPTMQNILEKQVEKCEKELYHLHTRVKGDTSRYYNADIYHIHRFLRKAIKESIAEAFEATRVEYVSSSTHRGAFEDEPYNDAITEQREKQELFLTQ